MLQRVVSSMAEPRENQERNHEICTVDWRCRCAVSLIGVAGAQAQTIYDTDVVAPAPGYIATAPGYVYTAPAPSYVVTDPGPAVLAEPPLAIAPPAQVVVAPQTGGARTGGGRAPRAVGA